MIYFDQKLCWDPKDAATLPVRCMLLASLLDFLWQFDLERPLIWHTLNLSVVQNWKK
jgi:hypothetical protein